VDLHGIGLEGDIFDWKRQSFTDAPHAVEADGSHGSVTQAGSLALHDSVGLKI